MKTCPRCEEDKPSDEFYSDRGSKDLLSGHCKPCSSENTNEWREANKSKYLDYQRQYREANREKFRQHKRKANGWSKGLIEASMAHQEGKCGVCGSLFGEQTPHADHDHDTKEPRGLLCRRCNLGLGMFQDDPARLAAAIKYLANPPVAALTAHTHEG